MPVGAAIAAAVLGGIASAGVAAALRPGQPGAPDLAASSRAGVLADLQALPGRRAVEAAARLGVPVDYATGRTVNYLPAADQLNARQLEVLRNAGLTPGQRVSDDQIHRFGIVAAGMKAWLRR